MDKNNKMFFLYGNNKVKNKQATIILKNSGTILGNQQVHQLFVLNNLTNNISYIIVFCW